MSFRVFISFSFGNRDKWIPELVVPLIRAFNTEVVIGNELWGHNNIMTAIEEKIRDCDALVGFRTAQLEPGEEETKPRPWATHPFVEAEITTAETCHRKIVEVYEEGVNRRPMNQDRQYIVYKDQRRDKCLVDIARAIGTLSAELEFEPQLMPSEFTSWFTPILMNEGKYSCAYRIRRGPVVGGWINAEIDPLFPYGLVLRRQRVPRDAMIQIKVEASNRLWQSPYVSPSQLSISMMSPQ